MEPLNLELDDRAIQGTVGFNTAFLWTCNVGKPRVLKTAELKPDQLRLLGKWCFSAADNLEGVPLRGM